MNNVLMLIAGLLMLASLAVFVRSTAKTPDKESEQCMSDKRHQLMTALVVFGVLFSLGGFWKEWMLWVGTIAVELACLIYFSGKQRGVRK